MLLEMPRESPSSAGAYGQWEGTVSMAPYSSALGFRRLGAQMYVLLPAFQGSPHIYLSESSQTHLSRLISYCSFTFHLLALPQPSHFLFLVLDSSLQGSRPCPSVQFQSNAYLLQREGKVDFGPSLENLQFLGERISTQITIIKVVRYFGP